MASLINKENLISSGNRKPTKSLQAPSASSTKATPNFSHDSLRKAENSKGARSEMQKSATEAALKLSDSLPELANDAMFLTNTDTNDDLFVDRPDSLAEILAGPSESNIGDERRMSRLRTPTFYLKPEVKAEAIALEMATPVKPTSSSMTTKRTIPAPVATPSRTTASLPQVAAQKTATAKPTAAPPPKPVPRPTPASTLPSKPKLPDFSAAKKQEAPLKKAALASSAVKPVVAPTPSRSAVATPSQNQKATTATKKTTTAAATVAVTPSAAAKRRSSIVPQLVTSIPSARKVTQVQEFQLSAPQTKRKSPPALATTKSAPMIEEEVEAEEDEVVGISPPAVIESPAKRVRLTDDLLTTPQAKLVSSRHLALPPLATTPLQQKQRHADEMVLTTPSTSTAISSIAPSRSSSRRMTITGSVAVKETKATRMAAAAAAANVAAMNTAAPEVFNPDESNKIFLQKLEQALQDGSAGGLGRSRRETFGPVSYSPPPNSLC